MTRFNVITFKDISKTYGAKKAIQTLAAKEIIPDDGSGRFKPARGITRAEFMDMLTRQFHLTDAQAACNFVDVKQDHPYYTAIASAAQSGLISSSTSNFRPDDKLTVGELQYLLDHLFNKILHREASIGSIQEQFINPAMILEYSTSTKLTRSQAAVVLYKLLSYSS